MAAAAKESSFVAMALLIIVTSFAAAQAVSDEITVNAREQLRAVAKPSLEVEMISMRGKQLLHNIPSYVHEQYTNSETDPELIYICDVTCSSTLDNCINRDGCRCTHDNFLDPVDTNDGRYCKWVGAEFTESDASDDTLVGGEDER